MLSFGFSAFAQKSIPQGSRVYIAPMGGFENNLIAALNKKHVPVVIVGSKNSADFEVGGGATTHQANWMRIWTSGTWRSDEKASIVVKNLHTDVIVYAYEVNKWAAWNGSQSAAEACAKHIKSRIVQLPPDELAAFTSAPRAKTNDAAAAMGDPQPLPGESASVASLGLVVASPESGVDGVAIVEITRGGAAELAGLHVGDVIDSVNDKSIRTVSELGAEVSRQTPGSQIQIGCMFKSTAMGWMATRKVVTLRESK